MSEEKVRVKVKKVLLESERQELKAKRKRRFLIGLLCFVFLIVGGIGGYALSSLYKGFSIASFKTNKFDKLSAYLNSVWLYKDDYEDLEKTLEDKAFYGMTNFPDDIYTSYMSQEEMAEFASSINNNYVGIGAQYSYTNGIGTVTRVFKDSPAEKGGLLAGDIFYLIEGESLEGLTSDEIKEKIVGEENSIVNVTVLRSGKEVNLSFVRGAIEYTAYAKDYDDFVYLNIMSFGESTADECINYLDDYKDYSKLVLDLRDNTGGYQGSVQSVAGLFLGKNVVVLNEIDNEGTVTSYETVCKKYYDNFKKIVILTNANTASAAEVLTICLKEMYPNASIVGTTTFGKGVVQSSYYLEDGSAIKLTTSYWTSPKGVSIHKEGVKPDYEVFLDEILYQNVYSFEDDSVYNIDDVSSYVKIAELGLKFLDFDIERTDGYFDSSFAKALKEYKNSNDLANNEILDGDTYSAIISSVIREYSINEKKDLQLQKAIEVIGE